MKNLTIKKIALGVFLAGYAASGFAATLTAKTAETIKGTPPVVHAGSAAGTADQIKVEADSGNLVSGKVSSIGDKVTFTFATVDADGDTDTDVTKGTTKNLTVLYGKKNAITNKIDWTAADSTKSKYTRTLNSVLFELGEDAGDAQYIGYSIQAETAFGYPDKGKWLGGNTLESKAPQVVDPNTPTTPGGTDYPTIPSTPGIDPATPSGPGDNGITEGPTETNPIPAKSAKFAIFAGSDFTDVANNYTVTATHLQLGDTYTAVYWNDSGTTTNAVEASETRYPIPAGTVTWSVIEGNSLAKGTVGAAAVDLTTTGNETITLPATNALAISTWTALGSAAAGSTAAEAGVQGFKLQATITR